MLRNAFLFVLAWGAVVDDAAAVGNLVDVTVIDRGTNRALPVYMRGGRRYVVGRPGGEYSLRLRNRTGADVLAVVSVDGVNAVSGETASWTQTGYVLGPDQGFDVAGWRKSLERVAAFFFTSHRNSYAARTGRPDNVGVIGVAAFRRAAAPEARIYREEPDGARRDRSDANDAESREREADSAGTAGGAPVSPERVAPKKSQALGTGHGRSLPSTVTYSGFDRATLRPEEIIEIHYDSYENLAALGVIPGTRMAQPAPFPGSFVPDPR